MVLVGERGLRGYGVLAHSPDTLVSLDRPVGTKVSAHRRSFELTTVHGAGAISILRRRPRFHPPRLKIIRDNRLATHSSTLPPILQPPRAVFSHEPSFLFLFLYIYTLLDLFIDLFSSHQHRQRSFLLF